MDTILRSLFNRNTQIAALTELVGTFFLTLAAMLAGTPFAVALTLVAFVYALGGVSGAHLNPAVTVGLMSARRFPLGAGIVYVLAQIVGALIAAAVAAIVSAAPLPEYQAAGVLQEFFGFGFLAITVAAAIHNRIPQAGSGVAIGAALAAGLLTSGGILNPAVAIAMGELASAATWATILSGVVFFNLFSFLRDVSPPEVV